MSLSTMTIEQGNARGGAGRQVSRKRNIVLWIVQGLLAAVFLFTGGLKLVVPLEAVIQQTHLPGPFLRFIGGAEVVGAIGLILPRLLRIRPWLTPLAAACLVIIMIGATVLTLRGPHAPTASLPIVTGLLAAFVAYGRRP